MIQKHTLNELYPIIKETLDNDGKVLFTPSGVSMRPLLEHRRDKVLLVPVTKKLKKYDIVFFQRKDGSFVLHRIVKIEGDTYWIRGDNQYYNEKNIEKSQIIAIVKEIERKGKIIRVDSWKQKIYAVVWVKSYVFRKILRKIKSK